MRDVSPDTSIVHVTGEFGAFTPQELFDYWVKPELLTQWWPREATVDARAGGSYSLSWPEQNWRLRGTYTKFEPGVSLGFTWSWDHDVKPEPTNVEILFEPSGDGTVLTLSHGPWGESQAEQDERQGVLEGWIHFGMRLAGLRIGEAT